MSKQRHASKRFYRWLAILGIALWFAETAYFGFNKTPGSGLEGALDFLSGVMIFWGIIGDLLTNVRITKTDIVNTRKMNYIDQREKGKTTFGGKR